MPQVFEQSQFLFPPDFDLALVFVTPKFTESPRLRWGCVYQWPPVNRSAFEQWMPKPQSVPGMGEKEEGGGNKGGKKNENMPFSGETRGEIYFQNFSPVPCTRLAPPPTTARRRLRRWRSFGGRSEEEEEEEGGGAQRTSWWPNLERERTRARYGDPPMSTLVYVLLYTFLHKKKIFI